MPYLHPIRSHLSRHAETFAAHGDTDIIASRIASALHTLEAQVAAYEAICHLSKPQMHNLAILIRHHRIAEDDTLLLLEDALLIIREKTLRTHPATVTDAEQDLMHWVMTGQLWHPEDGLQFSRRFFHVLPNCIMRDIMGQMLESHPLCPDIPEAG